MYLVLYVGGGILVGIVAGSLLGRFAVPAGIFLLLLGTGPMAALYLYSEFARPARDMSTEGMFSTLLLILATPARHHDFCDGARATVVKLFISPVAPQDVRAEHA